MIRARVGPIGMPAIRVQLGPGWISAKPIPRGPRPVICAGPWPAADREGREVGRLVDPIEVSAFIVITVKPTILALDAGKVRRRIRHRAANGEAGRVAPR